MLRSSLAALGALVALTTLGCVATGLSSASDTGVDPCLGVTCSDHGTCVVEGEAARCACEEGFVASGRDCLPAGPCMPSPCTEPHRSVCGLEGGAVKCFCDSGYWDQGTCVLATSCTPNPCTAPRRTSCSMSGGQVVCACDPGFHDDGQGNCVGDDLCHPNPCTEPRRSVCRASGIKVYCSCDPGFREDGQGRCSLLDPCQPNPCTDDHRSTCTASGSTAVCSCDPGYWDQGAGLCAPALSCDPTPCTAPHQTVCSVEAQEVVCRCDPGFRDHGDGVCAPVDPCQPNPCVGANRTVCRASGSVALCSCAPGFLDDGEGHCLGSCLPNPCLAPHQSVCRPTPTGTVCDCDANYVSDGAGGCRFLPPANCPPSHESGDAYEPDECQSMARLVTVPLIQSHTLAPVGDLDWLAFDAKEGKGYTVLFTPNGRGEISARDAAGYLLGSATSSGEPATISLQPGAGRFFLLAKATDPAPSTAYSLELREFADAVGNTADRATAVVGGTAAESLDYATDEDWFSFSGTVNHVYRVTLTCPGRQADFQVLGVDQRPVASGDSATPATLGALASGTYFVRVFGAATQTVSYTLQVEDLGPDDHGNAKDSATVVGLGTSSGAIQYVGDEDWLSFYAESGRVYLVTLTAATAVTGTLWNGTGELGSATTPTTGTVQLGFRASSAQPLGRYYLAIKGPALTSYTVKIADRGYEDHGDTAAMATHVAPGTTNGTVGFGGDVDYFTFDTSPGHIYRVTVQSALALTTRLSTQAGEIEKGEGTRVVLSALASGSTPHYVAVFGTPPTSYTLTLEDLGFDDHSDTTTGATVLSTGVPLPGVLETASDRDVFSLVTVPGRSYQAKVSSNPAVYLEVLNSSGSWIGYSNTNAPVVFGAASVGPYFIAVRRFSTLPVEGKYVLEVTALGDDDHSDTAASPTLVPLGTLSGGVINHPTDKDWFTFDGVADRLCSLEVIPSGCEVNVHALSTDGIELATRSGASPVTLQFKARATGRHYVWISGTMGPYFLRISDLGTDDHADQSAGATLLTLGAAGSGSVQIVTDVDWFRAPTLVGRIYRFTVTPMGIVAQARLLDDNHHQITSQRSHLPLVFTVQAKVTGSHYLEVASDQSQAVGSYTVLVEDLGTDDVGDTAATATPLVFGGAATAGAIQFSDDVDVFSFDVPAPLQVLKVTVTGISGSFRVLTEYQSSKVAPGSVTLMLPSGTYYVQVSSSRVGTYSIQVGP